MRVFLAGATGAIGQQLVPELVERGHHVTATTRKPSNVERLRALGAEPVVVDGLDGAAVGEAVARAEPEAVIHEMTSIVGTDIKHFDRTFAVTNELRTTGTKHLLAAAIAAGAQRFVAQSYTNWTNVREGGAVKTEDDPFDPAPPAQQRESMRAIRFVEEAVTTAPLRGIVLRYGNFYGPGVLDEFARLVRARKFPIIGRGTGVWSWIHVDDAATATADALERDVQGVFNIVDDDPAPVGEWLPFLAQVLGAKPPLRVPTWLGRLAAGEVGVSMMTKVRGSSNAKAKRELGWTPSWPSWREGFPAALSGTTATAP